LSNITNLSVTEQRHW